MTKDNRSGTEIFVGQASWIKESCELARRIAPGHAELIDTASDDFKIKRAEGLLAEIQAHGAAVLDRLVYDGIVDEATLRNYLNNGGNDE